MTRWGVVFASRRFQASCNANLQSTHVLIRHKVELVKLVYFCAMRMFFLTRRCFSSIWRWWQLISLCQSNKVICIIHFFLQLGPSIWYLLAMLKTDLLVRPAVRFGPQRKKLSSPFSSLTKFPGTYLFWGWESRNGPFFLVCNQYANQAGFQRHTSGFLWIHSPMSS